MFVGFQRDQVPRPDSEGEGERGRESVGVKIKKIQKKNKKTCPACLILVNFAAPVPPSWPEIKIWSAPAFATPNNFKK